MFKKGIARKNSKYASVKPEPILITGKNATTKSLMENGVYDVNHDTGAKILGDIVISMETAQEQAERYGHGLDREVGYLTAHSMLHLLGYDHENGGMERVRMREKEEQVMIQLGLPRTSSYTV